MAEFCKEHNISYELCGKVIVATDKSQIKQLRRIYERGIENRIEGLQIIDDKQLRDIEPHCRGVAAIHVGSAGIVDFPKVCTVLSQLLGRNGNKLYLNEEVVAIRKQQEHYQLSTTTSTLTTRAVINCAGLQADRVARMAGFNPDVRIIPFRGEYYKLKNSAKEKVNHLIYPLPDEDFPFLGVHCTRMTNGDIECGPNAVFAFSREGYSRWSVRLSDSWDAFRYKGFRKLARRHLNMGLMEIRRSFSKKRFTEAVQQLVPDIQKHDLTRATPGIRAIAVDQQGYMVDDFKFISEGRQLHVLNAPSPAATASLKLGEEIAVKALRDFDLEGDPAEHRH